MGMSVSGGGSAAKTAPFTLGPEVRVLTEDGRDVEPGSDEVGVLALGGRIPLGYYKDEAKTDGPSGHRRCPLLDARRLRGGRRGRDDPPAGPRDRCASTPAARRSTPRRSRRRSRPSTAVRDAVVVGIPHPTFGEEIVAVVEPFETESREGTGTPVPGEAELIAHVKERLATYKAPRHVRTVATIGRAPNGKVDYKRHRAESMEELGISGG